MTLSKGMGSIVPSPVYIAPDPIVASWQAMDAAATAAAAKAAKGGSMSGLGCTAPGDVCWAWASAYNAPYNWQGRDVLWQNEGLAGVGDFTPAAFRLPENPISGNAIGRQLAGLNGIDVSSLANFETSLMSGTSFGLPNLLVVGGAVVLFMMLSGGGGGHRR
jgi:hypothetical protein